MAEENKTQDAQIESLASAPEEEGGTNKRKISSEILIVLIIGFLFGIAIKTEVSKRINVADSAFYGKQGYSFAEIQERQAAQNQEPVPAPEEAPPQ